MELALPYAMASLSMSVAIVIRLAASKTISPQEINEITEHALLSLETMQGSLDPAFHPAVETARSLIESVLPSGGASRA